MSDEERAVVASELEHLALHLDEHFGSKSGGCVPAAKIEKLPSKYKAVARWGK